jgi:homoserine kinase
VRVKVPATSANLGPGFDVLGLALDYCNEVELSAWDSPSLSPVTVEVEGEGASRLPLDRTNLVYRMARLTLDRIGKPVTSLRVKMTNRIPLARGLGSSSAAIVGGILAANAGCGNVLSMEEMLRLAVEEEGHPDNVAPALMGGLCVSSFSDGAVRCVPWKEPALFQGLRAVVCVPAFELATRAARAVLPESVSRSDAVFNASRVALFLSALGKKRYDLLASAMEDRLHQPYRQKLVPGLSAVIAAARKAGAYGAALSGAGPSVLALCPPKAVRAAGEAMVQAFRRNKVASLWLSLEISRSGACVVKKNARGATASKFHSVNG